MIGHTTASETIQKMRKRVLKGIGIVALVAATSGSAGAMGPAYCPVPACSSDAAGLSQPDASDKKFSSVYYRLYYRHRWRYHGAYYVRRRPVYVGGGGGGGCCPNSMLVCPLGRHFC